MPIGIFDSGLGGLSVLAELQKQLPEQAFIYLADHKNAPYDAREAAEIFELTCDGVQKLFDLGCDLVLIACNTGSAVALHRMQTEWLKPGKRRVLGGFVPIIENLTQRDWGDNAAPTHTGLSNLALFATQTTVDSGAFAREMKFRARDVDVYGLACDGLVAAIESDDMQLAEKLVDQYVATMLAMIPFPQAAVLGSGHYSVVEKLFRKALPEATPIIAAPELVTAATKDYLERHPEFAETGAVSFMTTAHIDAANRISAQVLGQETPWQILQMDDQNA